MNIVNKLKQKSLIQRFLFVLGIIIFVFYILLAYFVVFWENFPLEVSQTRRAIMGILLVLYALFRFYRLIVKEING